MRPVQILSNQMANISVVYVNAQTFSFTRWCRDSTPAKYKTRVLLWQIYSRHCVLNFIKIGKVL